MSPTLICLALALVGVDLGYQPSPNGGEEFIIQINPTTLQALRPGERFDIDVPHEAQDVRPTHFSIVLGNASLPHRLPVAASAPPATAPIGPASPVLPAVAAVPGPSSVAPPGSGPVTIPPPTFAPPTARESTNYSPPTFVAPAAQEPESISPSYLPPRRSTMTEGGPPLNSGSPAALPAPATSADSRIGGLPPVGTSGDTSGPPNKPWLAMCLLVIALFASNTYVGWLFWDARQRYHDLLRRTFSMGQQAAEA